MQATKAAKTKKCERTTEKKKKKERENVQFRRQTKERISSYRLNMNLRKITILKDERMERKR